MFIPMVAQIVALVVTRAALVQVSPNGGFEEDETFYCGKCWQDFKEHCDA